MVNQWNMRPAVVVNFWVSCLVCVNPILNLVSEVLDQPLNGPGRSITQSTNGMTFDLSSKLLKSVNFGIICVTDFKSFHNVSQP